MADILIWDNNPGPVPGRTPFGFYDSDVQFQSDAPKAAVWAALRLGYPIMNVELQDINFYACFEQAVTEFSAQVNRFTLQNNYYNILGKSQDINFTQQALTGGTLNNLISIADKYGFEANTTATPMLTGSIRVYEGQQVYDLTDWALQNANGKAIEMRALYHQEPIIASQYFYGLYGDAQQIANEFGWNAHHAGATFMMYPLFGDLLIIQEIEMMRSIRKSAYSFEVVGNRIKFFPVPTKNMIVHFDYILKESRDGFAQTPSGSVTNVANATFNQMTYASINDPGKQWIKEYYFALAKELLGLVRSKYQSIPSADENVNLDGETLRNEALQAKEQLIEQLKTLFEEMKITTFYERQRLESEVTQEVMSRIPLPIYIGE